MVVIEWNAHLFSSDVGRYPMYERFTRQPRTDAPLPGAGGWDVPKPTGEVSDDYAESLRLRGIDRAVVVHPEPYVDDHRVVLDVLERRPEWLGTSLFYPRESDAPAKLEALVQQQPRIISTRFHAGRSYPAGGNYFDSFADPGVRALWAKAVELDLVVELHIGPDCGREVAEVLRTMPESKVLIDHLAEPHEGDAVEFADILSLAQYPNVYMKLSGMGHFADDGPLFRSALAFTRRVIEAFGPSRMVWGSGTPEIVDVHMSEYTEEERAMVKGGNLELLLPWPSVSKPSL